MTSRSTPWGVYRKYVEQKLALRLEGDHVIFRGDLRHHKDTRTNFTISNTSGAMGSPKVPQMEFLYISLTKNSSFFAPCYAIHSPFYWWMLKKTLV